MHTITLTSLSLAAFASFATAHTWAEQLQVIGVDGTYKGNPGYIRSYTPRSDPDFSDSKNVFLQPPNGDGRTRINAQDLTCAPQQQSVQYADGYPMLQAAPGDYYAIKYLENGHVTQPELLPGKPRGGGTVFVFMMSNLQPGTTLEDILKLSTDGALDAGKLIASGNFDDERCYQINPESSISLERQKAFPNAVVGQPGVNAERWCEIDAQIPTDAPSSGTLSGIWVWAWPTEGEGAKTSIILHALTLCWVAVAESTRMVLLPRWLCRIRIPRLLMGGRAGRLMSRIRSCISTWLRMLEHTGVQTARV